MKYRVYLSTVASLTVTVDLPDNVDPDEAPEQAIEKAFDEAKRRDLCAHCSGWGQKWSLDLADWDVARESDARRGDGEEIAPEKVDD
jgi:hypothetical protein